MISVRKKRFELMLGCSFLVAVLYLLLHQFIGAYATELGLALSLFLGAGCGYVIYSCIHNEPVGE